MLQLALRCIPRWLMLGALVCVLVTGVGSAYSSALGDEAVRFLYGINLNGPAVVIDGRAWDGQESSRYACRDKAFENQSVTLKPPTDAARAQMIRSSRWGGNRVVLKELPQGTCTLYLYVWEDNNSESYDVLINGRTVVRGYRSGAAGHWERLGPWVVENRKSDLVLESRGGAANFSGIEVWQGKHDAHQSRELNPDDVVFFEKRIRPLLVNRCYECHASDTSEVKGELLVDSMAALRKGGSNGPALVPGDVEASLLVQAVRYRNEELQMPPDEKLSDAEIKDLEEWIARGAPDPRTEVTRFQRAKLDLSEAKKFWSLQPLQTPPVPEVQHKEWPTSEIDQFVLAKMEEQGLAPGPMAARHLLLRRATFDLIGLPPKPEEVDAFVHDSSPDAFARVVDRLLDSPLYGERWGRYWLDVVRYADTAGDNSDFPIPQMHLYRDWVIDRFNDDTPYDRFVAEQLAGDLLPATNVDQRRRQVIATGYIAGSRRFGSRVDDYPQHLTIEDTLDNFGRAFLGLTINCSRCHDHKFDPITMEDYYGLYGIFNSTRYPWPGIELEQRQRDLVPLASPDEVAAFEKDKADKQRGLDDEVKRLSELQKQAQEDEKASFEKQLKAARDAAKRNSARTLPYPLIYAVAEQENPTDAAIQLKGDPSKEGDIVSRRFLSVLGGQQLSADSSGSGRLQLVNWLFDANNPLPARVMVNRIWQHHFGKGLVPTANDFGKQGKPPTHPELLDWLASSFVRDGWSIKNMHRRIMLSRTYQLASRTYGDHASNDSEDDQLAHSVQIDPNNDWLSSYPRRRLDAEAIRDTLLFIGGSLDLSPAGPHPFPPQSEWAYTQHKPFKDEYPTNRRSVYLMTQRIQRHKYLAIFDGADPSVSTPKRASTTTPLQSLFMLNDGLVHEQAANFASHLLSDDNLTSDRQRVVRAFQICLAREATESETNQALEFIDALEQKVFTDKPSNIQTSQPATELVDQRAVAWQALTRVLFRLNEFIYID